jgi:hypothetical protein
MTITYVRHTVFAAPRQWQAVADDVRSAGADRIAAQGGSLYGVWRSQIGRPRDELTIITAWDSADPAMEVLLDGSPRVRDITHGIMTPTLRPETADAPRRQGNYAFRSFETPEAHWDEFLDLCAGAWPGFESSYDSQVIGLWRFKDDHDGLRRSLLLTRRPDLAMWERSKIPQGEAEAEVRRKLSRRYDLCETTCVYTTTLLSADDEQDTVRWT